MRRRTRIGLGILLGLLLAAGLAAWLLLQQQLQRAQLHLESITGSTLTTAGLAVAQLTLRQGECLWLQAEALLLARRGSGWSLSARRLHLERRCPAAAVSAAPPAVLSRTLAALAGFQHPLAVHIDRLEWQRQEPVAVDLKHGATGWALSLTRAPGQQLALVWRPADGHCQLDTDWAPLSLALAGPCDTQGQLDLAGGLIRNRHQATLALKGDSQHLTLEVQSSTLPRWELHAELSLSGPALTLTGRLEEPRRHWQWELAGRYDTGQNLAGPVTLQLEQQAPWPLQARLTGQLGGSLAEPTLTLGPESRIATALSALGRLTLKPSDGWQLAYRAGRATLQGKSHWQTRDGNGVLAVDLGLDQETQQWQGSLALDGLQPLAGGGQLRLHNRLTLSGPMTAPLLTLPAASSLRLEKLALGSLTLAGLSLQLPAPLALPLVPASAPVVDCQLTSRDLRWQGRPLPALAGDLRFSPRGALWQLQASLTLDGQPVALSGRLGSQSIRLQWDIPRLSPASWLPFLPLAPGELAIMADGRLHLTGSASWQPQQGWNWQTQGGLSRLSGQSPGGLLAGLTLDFRARGSPLPEAIRGHFEFDELNPGAPLTQGVGRYQLTWTGGAPQLVLSGLQARLLEGILTAAQLTYPTGSQPDQLAISGLSLAALGQLQPDPSVLMEGRVDATLPLRLTPAGVSIQAGRLQNRGRLRIRLLPSPAVTRWLNSRPQLTRAGDYLRHMEISQLQARLSLAPSGLMMLDSHLKGISLSQAGRPVQLNYHHEENLLELLASLRLGERFSQAIERRLQPPSPGGSQP